MEIKKVENTKTFSTNHYDGYILKKDTVEGIFIYITFSYGIEVQVHLINKTIETIKLLNETILYGHEGISPKIFNKGEINFDYTNLIGDVIHVIGEQRNLIMD